MTLTFEPLIQPALWVVLAVASLAMLAWYARGRPWAMSRRRWAVVMVLMTASALLPLGILLNPTWHQRIPPPAGKPLLTLVVDTSASMSSADMRQGGTRYQAAARIARQCADQLSGRFDIRVYTFSGAPVAASTDALTALAPDGSVTDLATAISQSVELDRPQGQALLLLSDGIHNAGGGAARVLSSVAVARAAAAPIYTRTLGSDTQIHDLAVQLRSPQQLAFVQQTVPVVAQVQKRGRAPDTVTVVLTHDGKPVDTQRVALSAGRPSEARFQVSQTDRGVYRYEIRVEPFEGEVTRVNNYGTFLLRVVDQPIRVLLVEGKPYWDGKFLMRKLVSDPSIELVSIVRLAPGRILERTLTRPAAGSAAPRPAAAAPAEPAGNPAGGDTPTAAAGPRRAPAPLVDSWRIISNPASVLGDAQSLGTYQVLVLGRDSEVFLTDEALANIRTWLSRQSGSLVCYRGQPMLEVNQRLGRLLPVNWTRAAESRFRVRLTDRGRDLRWLESLGSEVPLDSLSRLPTLATGSTTEGPKPLATVLATSVSDEDSQPLPVVTFQPYGGGRVVVVEGSGMWRWAFLPPDYAEHDNVYDALWQSLLRWLVSGAGLLPGQQLALRADKVTFGADEQATATLLVRDEAAAGGKPAPIELTGEGLESGRVFTPTASGEEPGVFRVVFGKLPEGRYRARVQGQASDQPSAQTAFDVRQFLEEQLDLKARPDLMARIAASTGGAELEGSGPGEITARFAQHLDRMRPERIRRLSAWDRWWILLGAFALWCSTWGLRRSGGLV